MKITTENSDECYLFASRCITIPEFPRQPDAVDLIAADLLEVCLDIQEAEWVVTEARKRWLKWRGTAGLLELLAERRPLARKPIVDPVRQEFQAGEKPPVACQTCQDWGYLFRDGKYEYCSCDAGAEARGLQMCEGLNQWRTKNMRATKSAPFVPTSPTPAPRRPITEDDLQAEFAKRQDRTEQRIAEARETLARGDSTKDQREIAREILRGYGAPETMQEEKPLRKSREELYRELGSEAPPDVLEQDELDRENDEEQAG